MPRKSNAGVYLAAVLIGGSLGVVVLGVALFVVFVVVPKTSRGTEPLAEKPDATATTSKDRPWPECASIEASLGKRHPGYKLAQWSGRTVQPFDRGVLVNVAYYWRGELWAQGFVTLKGDLSYDDPFTVDPAFYLRPKDAPVPPTHWATSSPEKKESHSPRK